MSDLFEQLASKLEGTNKQIVFPEALDGRILAAASKLGREGIIQPILIGNQDKIVDLADQLGVDIQACGIIDPSTYTGLEDMVDRFVERRKGKVTEEEARTTLHNENYFGTMLVFMEKADGLVSGAIHSTGDTVRPAFQIIKTRQGVRKISGVFVMVREDEKYIFADCAINIAPDSQDLAEIAIESAKTASLFGVEPKVALLSFSTKGSAASAETERVIEALAIAKEREPNLVIDGELQFDAAFVPKVAEKKAPDSVIKGDATVFIFPSLEAGNIAYKITERLGSFEAIGPILQGLNKPVNDLSRGCSTEDVYKLALITAVQSL